MLGWLSTWLQQIIAVVLLAGIIDLLLPNTVMQRYVRLVSGLIILLTILTPVIRFMHGDFNTMLNQDVSGWFQGEKKRDLHMPTLEDIQRDAADLKINQQEAALSLTQRKLTDDMRIQIQKRTNRKVESVTIELEAATKGITAGVIIKSVAVVLDSSPQDSKMVASKSDRADKQEEATDAIEEVPVISIHIDVDNKEASNQVNGNGSEYIAAAHELDNSVKQILQNQWSVDPSVVTVEERNRDDSAN